MVFNARAQRDYLHSITPYIPSATFLSSFAWGQDGSANVLVNKRTNDLATIIIVGKVVHDRIFCGPSGTWVTGNRWGSLKDAKYQLTLHRPDDDIFGNDFDVAFKALGKVQSSIAVTSDRRNLLIGENKKVNNIRFSAPVFEERESVGRTFLSRYTQTYDIINLACQRARHPCATCPREISRFGRVSRHRLLV